MAPEGKEKKGLEVKSKLPPFEYSSYKIFHHLPELRNLIYSHLFDSLVGASNLKPPLTCRQIWHEAQVIAWSKTPFDLTKLKTKKLAKIGRRIPSTVTTRKVDIIRVAGIHLETLSA
jgi:hypothetical protein